MPITRDCRVRARWRRARGLVALGAVALTICAITAASSPPATPVGGGELAGAGLIAHARAGLPPPPTVPAAGWLVADLDTGQVLAARDPHGRFAPASTLKLLTALIVVPMLPGDRQVLVTPADAAITGTKVGVVPGHTYAVTALEQAMIMVSGNDAAKALAGPLGGDAAVVAAMNDRAAQLQALDTHAATVTGLDAPGQLTSAYDLALIGRAALGLPAVRRDAATLHAEFPGPGVGAFAITNHNPLLGRYRGAYGLKNGYTNAARASFVGAAARNGHQLIVTLVRADPAFRKPASALLDWGFAVDGKIEPIGQLVPLNQRLMTPTIAGAGGPQRLRHGAVATSAVRGLAGPDSLTWALVGTAAGVAVLLAARVSHRRRPRPYGEPGGRTSGRS